MPRKPVQSGAHQLREGIHLGRHRLLRANLEEMIQVILQRIVPNLPIIRCCSIRLPKGRVVRHSQVTLRLLGGARKRKVKAKPEASLLFPQQQVWALRCLKCRSMKSHRECQSFAGDRLCTIPCTACNLEQKGTSPSTRCPNTQLATYDWQ